MLTEDMPSRLFSLDASKFGRAVVAMARQKTEALPQMPEPEPEDVRERRERNLYWSAYEVAYCASGHRAGADLAKDVIGTFRAIFGSGASGVGSSDDDTLDALEIPSDQIFGRALIAARARIKLEHGRDVTVEELGEVTDDSPESLLERGRNGELDICDGVVSANLPLQRFLESRGAHASTPAKYDAYALSFVVGSRPKRTLVPRPTSNRGTGAPK